MFLAKKIVACLVFTGLLVFPEMASAQLSRPFGGRVTVSLPCTCTPGSFVLWLAPLYVSSNLPVTGALVYTPSARLYEKYTPVAPSVWLLGSFTPGVPACFMGIPPFCVPIPTLGVIDRVGTSLPGI